MMHVTYDLPVAIDDIAEAKRRLAGRIYKTGMPRSNYFSEHCKGEIFLKLENMQHTGSFKVHGVFNRLSLLTDAEEHKDVVTYSVGDHTQGVSFPCMMLGIDGKVVVPKGASKPKVAVTYDYSAEVVLHDSNFNDTIAKMSGIIETEGRILIPPYNDPKVITGQRTIGLEVMKDPYGTDNMTVSIGGGGLVTDIAVATKSINPTIHVVGMRSESVHGMTTSFHSGEVTIHRVTSILADGYDIPRLGDLAYETVRGLVGDIIPVSGDEIRNSTITSVQRNKVVIKGAGAPAYAALLSGKLN